VPDGFFKLITYLKAADATFADRWRTAHPALMREQEDFWRHVRRYVQNPAIDDSESPIDSPDRTDGVAELWFDRHADLDAALATTGFRDVILPDLAEFADLDASGSLVALQIPVQDGPADGVKLCAAGYRREGMARADAQRYWREVHPGVVASAAGYQRHVRRYVQNCPQDHDGPTIGRPLHHDIALEIFFDSVAAMTVAFGEPDYLETVRPDELRFADVQGGLALVTREVIVDDATG
jgi:uncharacterized protein (TIGR02118 family)